MAGPVKYVPSQRMSFGKGGMVEFSFVEHSQPLHHPLRAEVAGEGEGDRLANAERRRLSQTGAGCFRGITVTPYIGAQSPADLHLPEQCAGESDAVQSCESQQFPVREPRRFPQNGGDSTVETERQIQYGCRGRQCRDGR